MSRDPMRRLWSGRGGRWSVLGALLGVGALGYMLWRLDIARLGVVLAQADPVYLAIAPLAILAEQWLRAWKWRQLLHDLKPVPTLRLLGAIMGGYLVGMLAPVSPLVRAWLIARRERLTFATVLASVTVDRLVDGIVFTVFVAAALMLVVVPGGDSSGIRDGLLVAAVGSAALLAGAVFALSRLKRDANDEAGVVEAWLARLPARWAQRSVAFVERFAHGILWPRTRWRRAAVVLSSAVMKLVAASHLLWAGLAFGVLLEPAVYLFLIVLLGFIVVVAHFARIPGGFILGAVFALGLFGVDPEPALAMALVVEVASLATVAVLGAVALMRSGVSLDELPTSEEDLAHATRVR